VRTTTLGICPIHATCWSEWEKRFGGRPVPALYVAMSGIGASSVPALAMTAIRPLS
jgi:hypothetical protein